MSCKHVGWQRSEYYWIYSLTDEHNSPKERTYTKQEMVTFLTPYTPLVLANQLDN